ncbi:putative inorganic phosphate cotransporter isoform X1 [Periplaneta americana]|uniref:putative inorganic phosphate cotransporter isoform X1 n=1 Tax=Periplaneta americana TaxID=6978 RepID=UPI0037E72E53
MSGQNILKKPAGRAGGIFNFIPTRYVVAAMCFFGIMMQYTMKVDLSVVIVAMVCSAPKNTSEPQNLNDVITMIPRHEEEQDVCPVPDDADTSEVDEGEFEWDEETQGYTLSAYYYGYVATQLLGGRLSEILGSKVVIGPGVFLAGLFTLLSPLAARLHVAAFIATRVLVGAASGVVIPSSSNVLSKWFTVEERSFIGSLLLSGNSVGTIISMVLSGILAEAGGWPLPFYIFGGISICFIVPWFLLMYDTPEEHPRISDEEKNYILSSNGETTKKASAPVPWVAILTCVPLWIHIVMGVGYCWIAYTMLSELPTYLSNILHFDLQASGVLSALPYIFTTLSHIVFGYLSQWLRTNGYISKITAYRIFNGISAVGSAACLVTIPFMGCNSTVIMVLLVAAMAFIGVYQGGSFISHVDLGNNFAGTTAGITYTMLNSMGIVSPSITGILINGKQTLSQWAIVFYMSAAIYLATWTLYMLFGSADEQPWNKLPSEDVHKTKKEVV